MTISFFIGLSEPAEMSLTEKLDRAAQISEELQDEFPNLNIIVSSRRKLKATCDETSFPKISKTISAKSYVTYIEKLQKYHILQEKGKS